MAEKILNPAPLPSRRRALFLSTVLASAAGLGLVGHQAGFIVWDVQGVDLGFTQVAHAGPVAALPVGLNDGPEDTTEMLRRAEPVETGNIPAVDPFSVLERRVSLTPGIKTPRAKPEVKGARLANTTDIEDDFSRAIEAKDSALEPCAGEGCSAPDDIDDDLDDEVAELVMASIEDEVSGGDDVDKEGQEDCDDDIDGSKDDWDGDRDGGEGGGEGGHD